MSSREELIIQQQIKIMEEVERKSKEREMRREQKKMRKQTAKQEWIAKMVDDVPPCIEFRPTEEEFNADPLGYIKSIAHLAAPYGACKIIPPVSFRPECVPSLKTVQTKLQTILHRVDAFDCGGVAFLTSHRKGVRPYTIEEYRKMGTKRFKEIFEDEDPGERAIEEEFWHTMSSANNFSVQYGSDVEGTACQDSFGPWDLRNLASNSPLGLVDDVIPGVNAPMLYVGMLFAHFCWHYEDNALFSINYNHGGSPKIWYVSPGDHTDALEKTVQHAFRKHPDRFHPMMSHAPTLLKRKTVMCSPSVLMANNVPVFRCVQREREFIVTMPRGYHSGFNTGLHIGEAVNFALPTWIPYGFLSLQRYRATCSMSCLDMERMICQATPSCLGGEESLLLLREGKSVRGCNKDTLAIFAKGLSLLMAWQSKVVQWAESAGWKVVPMVLWAGQANLDRPLCGACNHICHMMYVQEEGNLHHNKNMCPEHWEYLGNCGAKALNLNLRYSMEGLQAMMSKLQNFLSHFKDQGALEGATCPRLGGGMHGTICACTDCVVDTCFEVGDEKCVCRGSDGKVLDEWSTLLNSAVSDGASGCPRSPLYFRDEFPRLGELLDANESKNTAAFRKHLLDVKPELAFTIPELHRLAADFKQEERLGHRRDHHLRELEAGFAGSPQFKGISWRCARIIANESTGSLKVIVKRKFPSSPSSPQRNVSLPSWTSPISKKTCRPQFSLSAKDSDDDIPFGLLCGMPNTANLPGGIMPSKDEMGEDVIEHNGHAMEVERQKTRGSADADEESDDDVPFGVLCGMPSLRTAISPEGGQRIIKVGKTAEQDRKSPEHVLSKIGIEIEEVGDVVEQVPSISMSEEFLLGKTYLISPPLGSGAAAEMLDKGSDFESKPESPTSTIVSQFQ